MLSRAPATALCLYSLILLAASATAIISSPFPTDHNHAIRGALPHTWYQRDDHPAYTLFRRNGNRGTVDAPTVGSPGASLLSSSSRRPRSFSWSARRPRIMLHVPSILRGSWATRRAELPAAAGSLTPARTRPPSLSHHPVISPLTDAPPPKHGPLPTLQVHPRRPPSPPHGPTHSTPPSRRTSSRTCRRRRRAGATHPSTPPA